MILHTLKGYIQTLYIAEYPDKLMLLDGASRADVDDITQFITQELNRPISDLKVVVITHMHPDHAGGANLLRARTGCALVSADLPNQWYSGLDGFIMHLTDIALAMWVAKRKDQPKRNLWYSRHLHPQVRVGEGDVIPGFEDWRVMETPGHTDRDLSLYHCEQDLLYVADLIVEVKQRLISPFPIFHPNQYRASVKRVFEMAPKRLLAAHGGEVTFDKETYRYLIETTPRAPSTHWRATKIQLRSLFTALWSLGRAKRKNQ
ncbi:MBL fold metallo-hydrolase [Vibrio sp. MarTm2]|uniref:MBL fold metallo-hydrolase n=1 Tax=Vibrio sp. MarTm2 TaxID=2998831 RepID=UPI0022CD8104|nr:MBL fold metallo-hydrolase [Vibrio sp. MarTm2]MDA0129044.1 MBL fold metallo-hydrolase [Vibrio sp. MarTm2]